jgi:phosphopantetheine adenylyltransferase
LGLVIDADAMKIIELMREYPKSYIKNINESEPELEKIVSSDRDDKKYMVRIRNEKGNIVTVHLAILNMRIRTSNPEARKSFRARHGCDNQVRRQKLVTGHVNYGPLIQSPIISNQEIKANGRQIR